MRPSPARARPAEATAWFPLPAVANLLDELDARPRHPHSSRRPDVRPRPARPTPAVRPSPARSEPHDPDSWFPLLALEALLEEDRLVLSGQTQALTVDETATLVEPAPTRRARRQRVRQPARRPPRSLAGLVHSRRAVVIAVAVATLATAGVAIPRLLTPDLPSVTLIVDGTTRSLETDADTVGDLLEEERVRVARDDRVAPGLSADIENGLDVQVFRAFDLTVDFDGTVSTKRTTYPTTEELMEELGLEPEAVGVRSAPDRLGEGATVVFRTRLALTIAVDGTTQTEDSLALTVDEFLADNAVVLGPLDTVEPPRETRATDGMTVTVVRVTNDTLVTAQEPLPRTEQRVEDPNLPMGETRVVDEGADGLQNVTYQLTMADGVETARAPVSKVPTIPPRPRIVAVGTALPNQRVGTASWYASPFGSDSCATKSYIPKGTIVRVSNLDTGASTTCRVADRVEANRVVDLDDDVFRQLAPLSQGVFNARIDW